jgi:hypothetical protein
MEGTTTRTSTTLRNVREATAHRLRTEGYTREQAEMHAARMHPDPEQAPEPAPAAAEPQEAMPSAASTNGQAPEPSQAEMRKWAKAEGIPVNPRGSVATEVRVAYHEAHRPKGRRR